MAPVRALLPPSVPGPGHQRSITRPWVEMDTVPSLHEIGGVHWDRGGGAPPLSLSASFLLQTCLLHMGAAIAPRCQFLLLLPRESAFRYPFSLEMSGGEGG